jgi:hypothetical protein
MRSAQLITSKEEAESFHREKAVVGQQIENYSLLDHLPSTSSNSNSNNSFHKQEIISYS